MDFSKFRLPRWNELPAIPLYMDQVLYVINDALTPLMVENGIAVATSSTVNSYVKAKLLEAPHNKKYTRGHLCRLILIYLLKRVMLISEIEGVLNTLFANQDDQAAYDLFCDAFQARLKGEDAPNCPPLLEAALQACCGKLNVEWILFAQGQAVAK